MKRITYLLLSTATLFVLSSCSEDDNNPINIPLEVKEYKIQIAGHGPASQQYPLNITYYHDNQEGTIVSEIITSETNQDIIQTKVLSANDKIGFKFTVDNNDEADIFYIKISDVETDEVLIEDSDFNIQEDHKFMYDISENNYSIQ